MNTTVFCGSFGGCLFVLHLSLRRCTKSPGMASITSWTLRCTHTTFPTMITFTLKIYTTSSVTRRRSVDSGNASLVIFLSIHLFLNNPNQKSSAVPPGSIRTWNTRSSHGAWSSPLSLKTPGVASKIISDSWVSRKTCSPRREPFLVSSTRGVFLSLIWYDWFPPAHIRQPLCAALAGKDGRNIMRKYDLISRVSSQYTWNSRQLHLHFLFIYSPSRLWNRTVCLLC